MNIEFQIYKMKTAMEMNGGDGCTTLRMYLVSVTCIPKNT